MSETGREQSMTSSIIARDFPRVHTRGFSDSLPSAVNVFATALDASGAVVWDGENLSLSPAKTKSFYSFPNAEAAISDCGNPSLFYDLIISLDLEIPPAHSIIDVFPRHILAMSFDAPAFVIPDSARKEDLAVCLAACRIAWEIRGLLIAPDPSARGELESRLHFSSVHALALGGTDVYMDAKSFLSNPGIWQPSEDGGLISPTDFGDN